MWGTVMVINSFVVWPATLIFLIYAAGRVLLYFDWKTLVIAIVVFTLATIVQVVLGILND